MSHRLSFSLDFAPHLGFPTPNAPLFSELAESTAPQDQILFAAANGFGRVQDPFVAQRSESDQASIGRAAKAAGLGLGCYVYAPIERAKRPQWSAVEPASRRELEAELDAAIAIGRRIDSPYIAVLTGLDPARSRAEQMHAMAANLARLADRAAEAGAILCVEAVNAQRLPQMLLHHYSDAVAIVRAAGHPAVRLIFDTAHVQAMDGDVLGNLDLAWDLIELIQIADHPGRVEPGAGELNFVRIVDEILQRGFSGPVELEHGWSRPGRQVQQHYLDWLGRWKCADEREAHGVNSV